MSSKHSGKKTTVTRYVMYVIRYGPKVDLVGEMVMTSSSESYSTSSAVTRCGESPSYLVSLIYDVAFGVRWTTYFLLL